jgi:hypothetical protein
LNKKIRQISPTQTGLCEINTDFQAISLINTLFH